MTPVIQILQLGLSGFAFLMVTFCFRLLRSEQGRPTIRPGMVRSIYAFMLCTGLFSVLVAVASFKGLVDRERVRAHQEGIAKCRDGLETLVAIARRPSPTADGLTNAIIELNSNCSATLALLDDPLPK